MEFRRYLIDEVKRKSFNCYTDILLQVIEFEKSEGYEDAYKKWLTVQKRRFYY